MFTTKHLPLIGGSDHSELFFRYKHKNETLGIVNFRHEEFFRRKDEDNEIFYFIKSFFNVGIELSDTKDQRLLNELYNEANYNRLLQVASYTETSALTKDFIANGRFDSPVCCKWHPYLTKWLLHPGRTRARVLYYFLEDTFEALAFNTQGLVSPNYAHRFNSKEEISSYITKRINRPAEIKLYCSAYWGSLLPDVFLYQPQSVTTSNFLEVSSFFKTTKINANFNLEQFDYYEDYILQSPQREVTIDVNSLDNDTLIRAMLLLPYHPNYEGYGVTIKTIE